MMQLLLGGCVGVGGCGGCVWVGWGGWVGVGGCEGGCARLASEVKHLPRLLLDKVLWIGSDQESVVLTDLPSGFT